MIAYLTLAGGSDATIQERLALWAGPLWTTASSADTSGQSGEELFSQTLGLQCISFEKYSAPINVVFISMFEVNDCLKISDN